MEKVLREALIIKYEGEIAEANANIQVYLQHPVGIGEHPDIVGALDSQMERIAEAEDKAVALQKYFNK